MHAVVTSTTKQFVIKSRAHWIALLPLFYFIFQCSAVCFSKCSFYVAVSCLVSVRASLVLLVWYSWEVYHWHDVTEDGTLGHSRGEGWELYQAPDKAAGTNNWQVALETNQLICMRQISLLAQSKEVQPTLEESSIFHLHSKYREVAG